MEDEQFQSIYVTAKMEGSIMVGIYKKGLTIDLELAKKIVKERLILFNGKSYPVLVDVRDIKFVTKDARKYFAHEGIKGMSALGIVAGNRFTVLLSNLFTKLSKTKIPTKVFMTREQAIQWLETFVNAR